MENNLFSIACDKIQGTEVKFDCKRKCTKCGSEMFEDSLIEPETIEIEELPVVTHRNWIKMSENKKREKLLNSITDKI